MPSFLFQRATNTGSSRKRVMYHARVDSFFIERAQNEWEETRFVADVPHDAKKGEVVRLALAAMLDHYHGQTSAGVNTACVTPGMANPYVEFNAVAAALAIS